LTQKCKFPNLSVIFQFIKGKYREHLLQKRSAIDPSQYESDLWIKWCLGNRTESKVNLENVKKALDMIEFMSFYDDVKYDYGSIMHIRNSYMSNNSKFVFTIDQSGYESMVGQEYWLSFTDIKLLNKRYCNNHCDSVRTYNPISCKNGGILSSYSCNSCICPNMFASDMYCSNLEPSDSLCPEKLLNATDDEETLIFESKYTCNVKIEASPGKRIKITILKARLPSHYPCFERLGLEIKYLKDKTVTGLCLCLLAEDIEIESEDEVVLIQYNGDLRGHMAYITYRELQ
uniref:Astacin domain-containing protein n=1 Tax=Strongyloides venezuelensis TaxID=75913 RepID=A0A0K0FLY1_STRVS